MRAPLDRGHDLGGERYPGRWFPTETPNMKIIHAVGVVF
jgi:hypothetical protein